MFVKPPATTVTMLTATKCVLNATQLVPPVPHQASNPVRLATQATTYQTTVSPAAHHARLALTRTAPLIHVSYAITHARHAQLETPPHVLHARQDISSEAAYVLPHARLVSS